MATQSIPQSYETIIQLFAEAVDGVRDHGPAVGLKHNTDAVLRPELEVLTGREAGPGNTPPPLVSLKARWNEAKSYKIDTLSSLADAKADGRALAVACVNALKGRLGTRWSNAWQSAGFTGGSLSVPDHPLTTLQQLRDYFTNHPDHEIPNLSPVFSATAAACGAAAQAITLAATRANESTVAATDAKDEFDAAVRNARKRLTSLREELAQLLARDDQRWYHFGFDRPSDPQVPEVPEGLRLIPGATGSGSLTLDWENARRAENYRVRVTDAAGVEVLDRLTSESELTLHGLASGQTVNIHVSARNGRGGESVPAPVLQVVVP
jgi:hypothetical protein